MVLMDQPRSAKIVNLADEDAEILATAFGNALKDPTYPERVRTALEKWKARH